MEFRINRQTFLKAVSMVEAVSRGAQVLEILKKLRLSVTDGRIEVLGSDHACYISAFVDPKAGEPTEDGVILVDARRFLGFLRSLDDEEVGFKTTSSGKHLNILSSAGRSRLLCEDADAFPNMRRDPLPVAEVDNVGDFVALLDSVHPFSLWEGSTVKLQSVHLDIGEDGIEAMASDMRRAAAASIDTDMLHIPKQFLLTNRAARTICTAFSKTDEGKLKIGYQDGQLTLETEDAFFLARTLDEEFPYQMMKERFFDHDQHQAVTFLAEPMLRRLGRVSLVADWQTPVVRFQFNGSEMVVGTDDTATNGSVEETLEVDSGEATGSLLAVVKLVVASIAATDCGLISLKIRDGYPAFIEGAWGDTVSPTVRHLSGIMPIVPKSEPAGTDEQS